MTAKDKYISRITNKGIFRLGMLKHLPSLFFWGVSVKSLSREASAVVIKHSWANKNPFGSIYFSALSGAAELSTGVLVQQHIQGDHQYSMLVVQSEAAFTKKAKGTITFKCNDGVMVDEAIATLSPGTSCTFELHSVGMDEQNNAVANFKFTWSVKMK